MWRNLLLPILINVTVIVMCFRYYVEGIPLEVVLMAFVTSVLIVNLIIYFVRRNQARKKGEHGSPKL